MDYRKRLVIWKIIAFCTMVVGLIVGVVLGSDYSEGTPASDMPAGEIVMISALNCDDKVVVVNDAGVKTFYSSVESDAHFYNRDGGFTSSDKCWKGCFPEASRVLRLKDGSCEWRNNWEK